MVSYGSIRSGVELDSPTLFIGVEGLKRYDDFSSIDRPELIFSQHVSLLSCSRPDRRTQPYCAQPITLGLALSLPEKEILASDILHGIFEEEPEVPARSSKANFFLSDHTIQFRPPRIHIGILVLTSTVLAK